VRISANITSDLSDAAKLNSDLRPWRKHDSLRGRAQNCERRTTAGVSCEFAPIGAYGAR